MPRRILDAVARASNKRQTEKQEKKKKKKAKKKPSRAVGDAIRDRHAGEAVSARPSLDPEIARRERDKAAGID